MFETVSSIDWAKLSHSHGPADEVPARLAALTGLSARKRELALDYFWEFMLHQGSRYEASAYVVPFLFEFLEQPKCPIQRELIDLLLAMAVGYGESFLPCGYDLAEEERRFEQGSWVGLFPYEEARSAYYRVHERAIVFNKFLHWDFDHDTRLSAAFAVAHFAQSESALHAEVSEYVRVERDPSQLQSLFLCFGMLARFAGPSADVRFLYPYLDLQYSPSLRVASAIALTTALGAQTPDGAFRTLLAALKESWVLDSPRTEWQWWNEGDLLGYAALALRLVGEDRRSEVVNAICSALEATEVCTFALPQTILDLLFPDPKPGNGWKVADFNGLQRDALRVLLRTKHWRDWMISAKFLPSKLTGEDYRSALRGFVNEVLGAADVPPDAADVGRAGNVSSWDLKKHWPSK